VSIQIRARKVPINDDSPYPIKSGNYILIEIQDEGKGIPLNIQHKVFEPYFTTKPN